MKIVKERDNPNLTTMGGRIEHARRLKHISQQELADKVSKLLGNKGSIQRQKIGYIEKNTPNRSLSTEELKNIANVLDVSTDYLLCRVSSNNVNEIDISKETGLNNDSIFILKRISKNNKSDILNYFIHSFDLEELTDIFKQYITLTSIIENLLIKPFLNIEKNYNNKKKQIATKEDILHIKDFLKSIDIIQQSDIEAYIILNLLLEKSQKELDTINKIYIELENNNGIWNNKTLGSLNLEAYKKIKNILYSFKDYFVFNMINKKIYGSLSELDKRIIKNEYIHKDLNLLNN
ncbi:MAG: helix-turn-helix transcriptional regulator [Clostridia bacterium]|nr:helix-turn-helix transcriptional regulator [Clostridia bacterium]